MSKIKHKDIKEFTVKRSKWMRNTSEHTYSESYLLDKENGKMCCLGFYARACKFAPKSILGVMRPDELCESGMHWETFLVDEEEDLFASSNYFSSSDAAEILMEINDDPSTADFQKEKLIKQVFARRNIKVNFID